MEEVNISVKNVKSFRVTRICVPNYKELDDVSLLNCLELSLDKLMLLADFYRYNVCNCGRPL